jgi:radical SAM protein with 4Fe4S-binding SPASM domain
MNRANAESLPELRRMLLQDLQPYCWQVQVTTPFGRAREDAGCTVGPVEYTRFACFVTETRRLAAATRTVIYAGDCLGYLSSMEEALRGWTWTGCGAGLQVMGIQSNGNVKGCLSIVDDRFVEGSIRQAPVREIWERPGAFAYTRDFDASQLHGTCAGCPVGAACRGGCTASSVSVNGRPHDAPYCLRAYEAVVAQPQDVKKTPKTRTTTSRAAARAHT